MKPILFNTEMVRAILDGRKTVTRRVVKPRFGGSLEVHNDIAGTPRLCEMCGTICKGIKPLYNLGDILYVRETWKVWRAHRYEANADIQFKAGGDGIRVCFANGGTDSIDRDDYDRFVEKWYPNGKWNPSIHMPKVAARIFLRVTNVRLERLQHIMDDPPGPDNQIVREGCKYGCDFIATWENTTKPADLPRYGWDANPWVWVIEFERCERPEDETGT